MIYVVDNYLDQNTFKSLQEYCNTTPFEIITLGEKQFSVLETPQSLIPLFQMEKHTLITTFIRSAHKEFDTDLRIHSDNVINGHKTALACVFYISGSEVSKNGTAFYHHTKYGKQLPDNISAEEFDRLITEDSNDRHKWKQKDIIVSEPNRLLVYNSNYFHSKFPQVIDRGVRQVLVCFYTKN